MLFSQRREHIVDDFINECRDAVGHSDGVGHIGLHDENQVRDALGHTDACLDIKGVGESDTYEPNIT